MNKNLFGISGRIGSGKDLTAKIIQYLYWNHVLNPGIPDHHPFEFYLKPENDLNDQYDGFDIRKFSAKLKQIVSILTGCNIEDLENQEFKNSYLSEEWWKFVSTKPVGSNKIGPDMVTMETKYETMSYRVLLQKVGTDALRNVIHENVWVNALFADYEEESSYWIISDMRFPNEMKAVKDRGGITIRINRTKYFVTENTNYGKISYKPMSNGLIEEHPSETALDNAEFDYVIDNNGTIDELIVKVKEILIKESIIK